MSGLSAQAQPLIDPTKPYVTDIGIAAQALRAARFPWSPAVATALENLDAGQTYLQSALRQPADVTDIIVRDMSGRTIAALGDFEVNGVGYSGGLFAELYAGFPFGISDPAKAIFRVTPDGAVSIGENGWLDVLDPFGADAAWIGTQYDVLPVTGGANNGSGLVRLTVTAHTLLTGDVVEVRSIVGLLDGFGDPVAQGIFVITKIDANHIDLQNSTFVGTYTSGGTVTRLLHISAIANAGGLIRITTAVAHGYITGDQVHIAGSGNANGQWVITIVDTTKFTLNGSTFGSGYTNGTALRYFAGGLFETIAVAGTTFPNAKFRALANGDLLITDARIVLHGADATITLDPTSGTITVESVTGSHIESVIDLNGFTVFNTSGNSPGTFVQFNNITLSSDVTQTGTNPATYALGPGPQLSLLPSEMDIQDVTGAINIRINDAGNITAKGVVDGFNFASNGTAIIDENQVVTNIASIDSVVYKVGGTDGLGLIRNFVTEATFNTAANAVFGTPGPGQSNGSVLTSQNTYVIKTLTFDSGILITEV